LKKEQRLHKQKTDRGLVEVWQKNNRRWLTIDAIEQSSIDVERPDVLSSPVHQAFMAALLFVDTPKKILLAGMGGGVFARYIHHVNPSIQGDAVEISEEVAILAKQHFYYPKKNWTVNLADIKNWQSKNYDLIIADVADVDVTPSWLTSSVMLQKLKGQLSKQGVLVINLLVPVGDVHAFTGALVNVRKIFNRQTVCLSVLNHKNIVIIAFNHPLIDSLKHLSVSRIAILSERWGVDFNALLKQIKRDNPEESMFKGASS